MIVAIDGPAGSGKSTTARRVAERMGWLYLDTGAMYRAIGLAFLEAGRPFTDEAAGVLLREAAVDLVPAPEGSRVVLGSRDVTDRLRTPEVADAASRASALAPVRAALVEAQRRIARQQAETGGGVVLEGRDIGTVVFPDADVKVFMTADLDARARRRHAELDAQVGETPALDRVSEELDARDRRDSERALAPLRPAEDAVLLDTTALSVEEQVERVLALIRERAPQPSAAARP
ncbi:MAG TPA: (d)CMP kinase [Rubricoccaceae bacterium]|nr:(d)CMP kinase [Rubricoccaceae bacterium]